MTPDENAGTDRAGPLIPDQVLYWVAIYTLTREYGGPEEGGWYYEAGAIETDPAIYRDAGGTPRAFFKQEEADAYARSLLPGVERLNQGWPHSGAAADIGRYEPMVRPGLVLETDFPSDRPIWS